MANTRVKGPASIHSATVAPRRSKYTSSKSMEVKIKPADVCLCLPYRAKNSTDDLRRPCHQPASLCLDVLTSWPEQFMFAFEHPVEERLLVDIISDLMSLRSLSR